MAWKKAPPALIDFLDTTLKSIEAERKMMFGYPVYFVNGNMFMGIFEDQLFLRLGDEEYKRLQSQGDPLVWLEPMKGRPMKNYYLVPERLMKNEQELMKTVTGAMNHAKTLKPKEKKKK